MKKILFVRHAKSSWADIKLDDKQRPLNKRGKRDAPLMAARCVEYGLKVQLLISSPAVRAFATCLVFQDIYNYLISQHHLWVLKPFSSKLFQIQI